MNNQDIIEKEKAPPGVASSDLLCVWNSSYPILAELGYGWYLVAHPNGPAIARNRNWQYLGHLARCEPDTTNDDVPSGIRYRAVDALMRWAVKQPTWPTHNS